MIISQEYGLEKRGLLTTLPALAVISKSDDRLVSVMFTEASREAVNSGRSLRHSVASALMIASVMSRDLQYMSSGCDPESKVTYERARMFPAFAFLQSSLARFSSSLASLLIFPGRFEA